MAVDMQTLLHQGTRHQNTGRAEALAEAKAQLLAGVGGGAGAADAGQPEQASGQPDKTECAPTPPAASAEPQSVQADEAPADETEQTSDETEPQAAEAQSEPEPTDDEVHVADETEPEPVPVRPCETPVEVPVARASADGDMDVQLDAGGTDRAQSAPEPIAVATPPRRGKAKAGAADAVSPADTKQVRGIAAATVSIARTAFPSLSIGDAVNAYVAWKSGDLSGLTPELSQLVRAHAAEAADPLEEVASRLASLEKKMDKQARALGELEVYTVFVMLDRLGFRPAGTIASPSDLDLSVIKDVPAVMPRLARQADEICRKVATKQGRPRSQTDTGSA